MSENYRGIYDHFPMQAALGLYSLHRFSEEDKEKTTRYSSYKRKGGSEECTQKKSTSATTKDTKP